MGNLIEWAGVGEGSAFSSKVHNNTTGLQAGLSGVLGNRRAAGTSASPIPLLPDFALRQKDIQQAR